MTTIIKNNRVEVRELTYEELMSSALARGANVACEPTAKSVRTLTDRGHVHALEVTCSCGDVTVIELDYPEAPDPANSTATEAAAPEETV